MPRPCEKSNIIRWIYETYDIIGKEMVTAEDIRGSNDKLRNYFSNTELSRWLGSNGWINCGRVRAPSIAGKTNKLTIWKPDLGGKLY